MADHHATYNELLSAITELLPRLQARFARYQLENFPQRVPEFFCLELCGEVGELANLEKNIGKEERFYLNSTLMRLQTY